MWWDDFWGFFVSVGVIGVVIAGGYYTFKDNQDRKILVKQCIADGRKPYECEAMFRSGNVMVIVPDRK